MGESNTNLNPSQNFNWQAYNQRCKQIIGDAKDRFIDLAPEQLLDEDNSNYLEQIQEKQIKFCRDLDNKLNP